MLNNLALLGIIIILLWIAAAAYYIFTSRQQKELSSEIEELREILDKTENGSEANVDSDQTA
jgi:DNA-binding GntR family transcriptional regulator